MRQWIFFKMYIPNNGHKMMSQPSDLACVKSPGNYNLEKSICTDPGGRLGVLIPFSLDDAETSSL